MKKNAFLFLSLFLLVGSAVSAWAETPGTPEYEALKKVKADQRARREEMRQNPAAEPTDKGPTFWDREAERSGLAKSKLPIVAGIRRMNPVPFLKRKEREFNERKYGAVSQPAAVSATK